jgi:hypothetical protein
VTELSLQPVRRNQGPGRRALPPIVGKRWGKVVVLSFAGWDAKYERYWNLSCDCGVEFQSRHCNIMKGIVNSCGCAVRVRGSKTGLANRRFSPYEVSWNHKYCQYRGAAKTRGLAWNLSFTQARGLMSQPCFYCGAAPEAGSFVKYRRRLVTASEEQQGIIFANGIDRKDNTNGYSVDNCVSCCTACNLAKGTRTLEDFLKWAQRVSSHHSN